MPTNPTYATATTDWLDPTKAQGLMGAPVTPTAIQPTNYNATAVAVDPTKATVAGQLKGIIDAGSPLMTTAATRAKQAANAAGLMNSSMAVQAGEQAVIQTALPIAQQDASTYFNAATTNAAAENAANQFNSAAEMDVGKANTAAGLQAQQFNAQQQNAITSQKIDLQAKAEQFNASQSNDMTKLNLDMTNKQELAAIEANYKNLMQANASSSEIYKQAVKNITDIMTNSSLGQTAKDTAVQNQIAMLRKGLEISGAVASLDLGQYLDFSGVPA